MKTRILLILFYSVLSFGQPDSFSTTIYDPNYGQLDIVLYKYSCRSTDYQIFLYDGVNLTPYPIPQIRTYRGYIANMENSKITAVWYPDNKIYLKLFNGKGEQFGFQLNSLVANDLNINNLSLPIVTSSKKAEMHLTSGYTTNFDWVLNTAGNNVENAIAIFENGVNQYDLSIARDIGTSMSVNLLVIPTVDVDFFNPNSSNYPGLNITHTWWRCYGGGGGAGRHNYCGSNYKGGRTSLWRAGFGAMPHEFGHTLDMGHHHNQYDAMHSNQFYLGRDNAIRAREHLGYNGATCLEVNNPNYTDPVHPYTPEDYATTNTFQSVLIEVLSNDVDYNGETVSIHDFDSASYYGGTITQEGQSLRYHPPSNFIGKDFFYYKAKSGSVQNNTFFWNEGKVSVDVRDNEDLALYFPFEETKGNIIFNQTNTSRQYNGIVIKGTMSSMSNNAGVIGKCIRFGTNQRLEMNDVLDPYTESLSISFWFSLDQLPGQQNIVLFDSGSRDGLNLAGLGISIEGNEIHFYAQHEGKDNTGADRFKTVNWQTNKWYHVALVVNRSNNKLYGYLDGVEVGNSAVRQNLKPDGVIKGYPGIKGLIATAIGAECRDKAWEDTKGQLLGKIDEFKIFKKALTSSEVNNEFTNPIGSTYVCPEGLFNESVEDASFELNVLTLQEKDKIMSDWYPTDDTRVQLLWSDFGANVPSAPHGKNWCFVKGNAGVYQQIGIWEPNKTYTVNFKYGKRLDAENSNIEVSLWVGNSDYPERNKHLSAIGAQKIDAATISASVLNNSNVSSQTIALSTNGQNYNCESLWIMFENKNATNQHVNLIDKITIYDNSTMNSDQFENDNEVRVYPNPTTELLNIESRKIPFQKVEILDNLGRKIKAINRQLYETQIDMNNLTKGIYHVVITYENETINKKIIKN